MPLVRTMAIVFYTASGHIFYMYSDAFSSKMEVEKIIFSVKHFFWRPVRFLRECVRRAQRWTWLVAAVLIIRLCTKNCAIK